MQCSQLLLLRSLENKRKLFLCTNIMAQNYTWRFGRQRRWGESAWVCGGEPGPTSSEKASYQAALEGLHKGGFPRAGVSKQLQFDPGLWILCVPQLLDKNPPVSILKFNIKKKSECVAGNFWLPTNSTWGLETLSCQSGVHLVHHVSHQLLDRQTEKLNAHCQEPPRCSTKIAHLQAQISERNYFDLQWKEQRQQNLPLSVSLLWTHQSQKVNQYTYSYRIYVQHWRILLWQLSPEPFNNSMCISSLLYTNFFCASHVWVNFKETGRRQESVRTEELDTSSLSSFPHLKLREKLYCSSFAPNLHVGWAPLYYKHVATEVRNLKKQ